MLRLALTICSSTVTLEQYLGTSPLPYRTELHAAVGVDDGCRLCEIHANATPGVGWVASPQPIFDCGSVETVPSRSHDLSVLQLGVESIGGI